MARSRLLTILGGAAAFTVVALTAGWAVRASAQGADKPATPPEITIMPTPAGPIFADRDGYALYVTERDTQPSVSKCSGPCIGEWPPVRASEDAKPFGEWSLVPRTDGLPQWAYKGRPLYRYRREARKNWAEGQGDVWKIATAMSFPVRGQRMVYLENPDKKPTHFTVKGAPPGVSGQAARGGIVLADARGLTVYTLAPTACKSNCAAMWVPVTAPEVAVSMGEWTIITRPDGAFQWAYKARPLYRCDKDVWPGDALCTADGGQIVNIPSTQVVPVTPTATPSRR